MIWPASLQFILWVPHIFSLTSSDSWSPWDCNNSHFQQTELLLNILIICESQYDVPGPISRMNTESKNQQIVMCKMLLFVTDSAYSVYCSQRKVNYEHLYSLQTRGNKQLLRGACDYVFVTVTLWSHNSYLQIEFLQCRTVCDTTDSDSDVACRSTVSLQLPPAPLENQSFLRRITPGEPNQPRIPVWKLDKSFWWYE